MITFKSLYNKSQNKRHGIPLKSLFDIFIFNNNTTICFFYPEARYMVPLQK